VPVQHAGSSRRIRLLLLICGLLLWPVGVATAQPRWSEAVQLSSPMTDQGTIAATPDLTVDPAGNLHVVWYSVSSTASSEERPSSYNDQIRYRARINDQWTTDESIFSQERPFLGDAFSPTTGGAGLRNDSFALRASLLAGYDNQLHMVLGNPTTQWFLNAPLDDVVRTMAILPPWTLAQGVEGRIAGSPDGTLHAMLSAVPPGLDSADEPDICTTCTDIFYRRSEDGGVTWSRPENLSRAEVFDQAPQIAVDHTDRIHVVWESGNAIAGDRSASTLMYQRSDDQGRNWREPIRFSLPGEGAVLGALAVSHTNTVLIVYAGTNSGGVFYQVSPDGGNTWSEPGLIPTVLSRGAALLNNTSFSLAADGNGHVHLLMVGVPPATDTPSTQLLHLTWDGQNWSEPAVLSSSADNPRGPRLVIERGNRLHAVWSTSTLDPETDDEQEAIWYSASIIAVPELAPAPTLTPILTPIPAASPTPVIVPTATPLPISLRELDTIDGPPLWELRGLQAVGLGLLATALVIAFIGTVWLRSRSE
jgi:hypothetical protein